MSVSILKLKLEKNTL